MKPGVCLVLTGPTLADCQRQLDDHRPHIDRAELRADLVDRQDWAQLNDFSRQAGLPLILTLRQSRDGGQWSGSEGERRAFFQVASDGAWKWFDLEDDQRLPDVEAGWLARGRHLVISFHDFDTVPPNWTQRLKAVEGPGITPKAAVYPRSSAEFLRFTQEALALGPGNRVVLAMGPFGFPSRVLAARYSSAWTYTTPAGTEAAPGLVDPDTLQNLYRFRSQTATTPVFGIIGNPVFHTKSPLIHNQAFEAMGLPGTYLPFLVDDLKSFFTVADLLGVEGLSCTIPYKEDVLLYLSETSPAVKATGACNTLWRDGPRRPWKGDNTDAPGFMAPLVDLLGDDLSELRATVVGTGGAARGVVWALCQAGVKVVVLGRTPDKAQALAQDFGAEWAPLGPEARLIVEDHPDLIVQTTSVGMGDSNEDPLDWYEFTGREVAYDIIYTPKWTPFLTRAKAAGCKVLFGQGMLMGQAVGQFRRFTGKELPLQKLDL